MNCTKYALIHTLTTRSYTPVPHSKTFQLYASVCPWSVRIMWRHRSRDNSISHIPFPIDGLLEPSLYLYRFSRYWALTHIEIAQEWPQSASNLRNACWCITILNQTGPDLRKWRRAPDGCVTPPIHSRVSGAFSVDSVGQTVRLIDVFAVEHFNQTQTMH